MYIFSFSRNKFKILRNFILEMKVEREYKCGLVTMGPNGRMCIKSNSLERASDYI